MRLWSEPGCDTTPTIRQALRLDAAYRLAGGAGAPFLDAYRHKLEAAIGQQAACSIALAEEAGRVALEVGEAVAASIAITLPGASPRDIDRALADVRQLGTANIRGGRVELVQSKTGKFVSVPIMPALAASILAADATGETFVLTEFGKRFSAAGFGNKVRQWCTEAGLTGCSAHGLRKAAARRFAEAGCSNQEIKAWTGHTTDFEVARYTAAADQLTLSNAAAQKLLANLAEKVANSAAKPAENKE